MPCIRDFVSYIPFFWLQIAPFCIVAILYGASFVCRNKRTIVLFLSLTESLSCGLISFHDAGGAAFAFGYGCLLLSVIFLLSPLLRLHMPKKIKEKGEREGKEQKIRLIEKDGVLSAPPEPKAVTERNEGTMSLKKEENDDVQLSHVFQVLKKLQSMKLSAGDRLETDVIYNMVTVYQAKKSLSAEETHILNNYLATLLKLMSKYSL